MDAHRPYADSSFKFLNETVYKEQGAVGPQFRELLGRNSPLKMIFGCAIQQDKDVKNFGNKHNRSFAREDTIWTRQGPREERHNKLLRKYSDLIGAAGQASLKEQNETIALKEELDRLKKENHMREEDIKKLRAEVTRVTYAHICVNHQNAVNALRKERNEMHSLQKKLDENKQELDTLKKEKCLREQEAESLRAEISRLTRALADHQDAVEKLSKESNAKHSLQSVVDQLNEVNCMKGQQIENLKAENLGFTRDLADLQKTVDMLKETQEQKRTLQETLYGLKEVNRVKDEQIEELRTENTRITRTSTDDQNTIEILKKVQQENHTLQEELDRLKKYSSTRENEIEKLRAKAARVTRVLVGQQNTVKILKKELQEKRELEKTLKQANCTKDETIANLFADNSQIRHALAKYQDTLDLSIEEQLIHTSQRVEQSGTSEYCSSSLQGESQVSHADSSNT